MTTVVSIMMSDIVPLRERGTWQGILNIIYAAGSGSGAPLGMVPATRFNSPLCADTIPITASAILLLILLRYRYLEKTSCPTKTSTLNLDGYINARNADVNGRRRISRLLELEMVRLLQIIVLCNLD